MADHHVSSGGGLSAIITIMLGIFAKVTASDLASFMTITVGAYTLFNNYPSFKRRVLELWEKYKRNQ